MVTKLRSIYYNSNTIGTVTESKQIIKSVNSLWLWHGHFHHQKSEICYLFHWKRNPGGSEELIFGCLKYLAWVWFKITESKSLNLLRLKQHLKRVIQITYIRFHSHTRNMTGKDHLAHKVHILPSNWREIYSREI